MPQSQTVLSPTPPNYPESFSQRLGKEQDTAPEGRRPQTKAAAVSPEPRFVGLSCQLCLRNDQKSYFVEKKMYFLLISPGFYMIHRTFFFDY